MPLLIFQKIIIFLIPLFLYLFLSPWCFAQKKFKPGISLNNSDNFKDSASPYLKYSYNKKRIELITAANIAGYGGTLIALNSVWYSNYARSPFHFFNDDAQWLQVDKAGHVYSAYIESHATMEMWRWAGLTRKKSIWIGGLSGVAYQSVIEVLDGFSSEYGFSPGDFIANILGSATFISQELAWNEQRIKIKFSFHKINYGEADLNR